MPGCITADYKDMLVGLIAQELGAEVLSGVVKAIPLCEERPPVSAEVVRAARKAPALWIDPKTGKPIEPIYYDEKGKKEKYSSISALVAGLGYPMSGIQCDVEGKKCKAMSAAEILQIHGYTVSGDGEPEKGVSRKLTVYHPEAPQLKKLAE